MGRRRHRRRLAKGADAAARPLVQCGERKGAQGLGFCQAAARLLELGRNALEQQERILPVYAGDQPPLRPARIARHAQGGRPFERVRASHAPRGGDAARRARLGPGGPVRGARGVRELAHRGDAACGTRRRCAQENHPRGVRHVSRHRPRPARRQGFPHRPSRRFQRPHARRHARRRRDGACARRRAAQEGGRARRARTSDGKRARAVAQSRVATPLPPLEETIMKLVRSAAIAVIPFAALAAAHVHAWEPTKPVEIVVAAGAGGASDQMARMMQAAIQKNKLMGQPMVVSLKGGASGAEALMYMKSASGDANKVLIAYSLIYMLPLSAKIPFNWRELTPVSVIALDQFVLWDNTTLPYQNVKEFVEAAKKADPVFKMGGTGSKREGHLLTIFPEKSTVAQT